MPAGTHDFATLSVKASTSMYRQGSTGRCVNALNTQMGRDLVRYSRTQRSIPKPALHRSDRHGRQAFCAGGDLKNAAA